MRLSPFRVEKRQEPYQGCAPSFEKVGHTKPKGERGVGKAAIAFESALKQMHSKIRTQIEVIAEATKDIPSASHYTSPFANLDEQAFADHIFSLLA